MDIRSELELVEVLDKNKKDRKRELISMKSNLLDARRSESAYLRRAAVVISYAHWEGFVKKASVAYLEYIRFISPDFRKLSSNIKAVGCKSILVIAQGATKRITPHLNVVKMLSDVSPVDFKIAPEASIDTESNLNWEVFENISHTIGIDFNQNWPTYKALINDMVKNRCLIAHGELYTPPQDEAIQVLNYVYDALDWFTTDVVNAVSNKTYLQSP